MTASHETDDLAVLEQTRARLETELARDENWRALKQSGMPGEESAARRARDTRLEMALADHPAYRAWKHVNEAIVALRQRGANAAAAAPARPAVSPAARPAAVAQAPKPDKPAVPPKAADRSAAPADRHLELSELPKEIVDLIRAGSSEPGAPAPARAAAAGAGAPAKATPPQPPPRKPEQPSLTAAIAGARVVIPSVATAPAEPRAKEQPAAPKSPPSAAPNPAAGPAAGKAAGDAARAPAPEARMQPAADWEEATVTFVTREARPSLLPSAALPADLGTDRKSTLFERLRGVKDQLDGDSEAFAPPSPTTEEAEVTILTPEAREELRKAEARAGTVRRLRKALSGD